MAGAAGREMGQAGRRLRYKSPPVAEVCLGVQFDLPRPLKVVELADLHRRFATQYPQTEDMPPLPPVVERFGSVEGMPWELQVGVDLPNPRCWFKSQDDSELIQVQSGKFLHNWRRIPGGPEYPSYRPLARRFREELQVLCDFLTSIQVGTLRPNQCELTYIDHLFSERTEGQEEEPNRLFTFLGKPPEAAGCAEREALRAELRYLIPSTAEPSGRIHVSVMSGRRRSDGLPLYILQMTARGAPQGEDVEGVFGFLDLAHEAIFNIFQSMIRPEIREKWGPYDVTNAD